MLGDFLSLIYPKLCVGCAKTGSYLCPDCAAKVETYKTSFCSECGRASIHGLTHQGCLKRDSLHGLICLFNYEDPLRKLIHQIKYKFSSSVVEALEIPLNKTKFPVVLNDYSLVPLPLHGFRENWRGFNQAELLGQLLSKQFGLNFIPDGLERRTFEKSQVKLSLAERKANLAQAFVANKRVTGRNVIVIDDIWTTGATLREASRALKKAGANHVWGLCLATSHRVH